MRLADDWHEAITAAGNGTTLAHREAFDRLADATRDLLAQLDTLADDHPIIERAVTERRTLAAVVVSEEAAARVRSGAALPVLTREHLDTPGKIGWTGAYPNASGHL